MTTIITRNSSIPSKQSEVFSTGTDFQESVEIHILQGERPFAKDNKSLGIFRLKGIPPAPRGVPKINVTFQLDVNGLLSVSAREEQTGKEQSIRIEGASVLSREDVSKMIKEAEENAILDKSKKSYVNITYELDNLLLKSETLLDLVGLKNDLTTLLFLEILKEIKTFYKLGQLENISLDSLDFLQYSYSLVLAEYVKSQLIDEDNSEDNSGNGVVIDV